MSELFDRITRIVGSPIPRRQALKAIGGALVGVVFAGSAHRKTYAAVDQTCCQGDGGACVLPGLGATCPQLPDENNCLLQGGRWIADGQCCTEVIACLPGETCCGLTCCPATWTCTGVHCCPPERLYNNNTDCCTEGTVPTNNRTVCCPADKVMPNDQCCNGTIINGACCPAQKVCHGVNNVLVCCSTICCGGTRCCTWGCTPDGNNCATRLVSAVRM